MSRVGVPLLITTIACRFVRWFGSREVAFGGAGALALLFIVVFLAVCAREASKDEITLADPPSGAVSNPHAPNALIPSSDESADGLYKLGLEKVTALDSTGGYWHFKECMAFNPGVWTLSGPQERR